MQYQFKIVAENIHGWGAESFVFTDLAADQPSQPAKIVTTAVNINMSLKWIAPATNYYPINSY